MKTIVHKIATQLFVIILIAIGSEVKAQYPYNFSFAGIPYDSKTIVRSYDEQHAVVYYEDNIRGYVSLVDVVTSSVITVPLDDSVYMNDMCIFNDSVFLCGYDLSYNFFYGCIATMSLNNFYSGSVLVSYFHPSYWMDLNLKRIKGFKYTLSGIEYVRFLLVGEHYYKCDGSSPFPLNMLLANNIHEQYYTDNTDHSTCTVNAVFEVRYPFPNIYTPDNILRFINPTINPEVIHDVVVTDNYVAFVGVEEGSTNKITLHVCNKSSHVLYTNAPSVISDFDNYYTYSLGTTGGSPFYHACALDRDRIAIATQDETSSASTKITIRTFDLLTHTMTHAQDLQCNSAPQLKDIAYIPDLQKVMLLYHDYFRQTGSFCDVFCTVDPFNVSPSYTQSGMAEDVFHTKYGSLDAMKAAYFISTGGRFGFMSDAANYITTANCYNVEDYTIYKIDCINATPSYFNYDIYRPTPTNENSVITPDEGEAPSQCMDY